MTWDKFVQRAEASSYTWEIFLMYNDLVYQNTDEEKPDSVIMEEVLEYYNA